MRMLLVLVTAVLLHGPAAAFSDSDLPPELKTEVLFSDTDFVSNDELRPMLDATSATPDQVQELVDINEDARLRSLRASR